MAEPRQTSTDVVVDIIWRLAAERESFTSDDIRPLLPSGIGPRSIPAAVGKARRDGIVEEVDRVKSVIPERKGSLVPVLRRPGSHLANSDPDSTSGSALGTAGSLTGLASEIVALKDHLNKTGYVCGVEEVATFLLLAASRNWVILSGPSGTGKSSLVRRVAEALDGVFHDIQVKPNWVSSEDSLGYFSEVSQTFVPGVILNALQSAQSDPDRLHFVRLDEMNLASPEYYLAEVLSGGESWQLDELGRPQSDVIQLPPAPLGVSRPQVRIHNNVFMIGTVNVDETTRALSPKVLDRSAVFDLHHVDLFASPAPLEPNNAPEPPALPHIRGLLADRPHSLTALGASNDEIESAALLLSPLGEVGGILGGPIGYRQRDALVTMLALGTRHGLTDVLSPDTILDIGLRSIVLPKWQGSTPASRAALRHALAVLLDIDVPDDASTDSLQAKARLSRFPRSCEKVLAMIHQFNSLGYFSAW
ncbi:McrB family protein [Rhodococcus gannanensis]|uniref:McrB family protein n=1 Tax=Rhodococcus gannanensis TaxID=1960308 RepID=A0ABW4P1M9_9NOCA